MKRLNATRRYLCASAGLAGLMMSFAAGPTAAQGERLVISKEVFDLCERTSFTKAEVGRLQKRGDYADIMRYTLSYCPPVAAALASGATASVSGGGERDFAEYCDRTQFTRNEITRLQRQPYFDDLLEYTLENCAGVAAALTSIPTASVTDPDEGGNGDGGSGGGGTGGGDDGGTGGGDDGGTGGGDDGGTGGGDDGGTGGGDDGGTGGGDDGDDGAGTGGEDDDPWTGGSEEDRHAWECRHYGGC